MHPYETQRALGALLSHAVLCKRIFRSGRYTLGVLKRDPVAAVVVSVLNIRLSTS